MNAFEQIRQMKQDLYEELTNVLDNHRVHIGEGMLESDVIGIIELVKFDYLTNRED
jgi:hypothetical protein